MHSVRKYVIAILAALFLTLGLSACTSTGTASPQDTENKTRQAGYGSLVANQPTHQMSYSPTRATKNFWVDTWGKKGKLSYVYLLNSQGDTIGYYILEGLPVSYCTSLIPPYQTKDIDLGDYWGQTIVPGPSVDGTFASASNCNVFYGKDATTGAYVEYTTGQGINALLYDAPLPRFKTAQPLGQTELTDVK